VGIKVALEHRTSYTFDRLVEVYPHVVRLRPAPHSRTPVEAYSLTVEPRDHFINWQQDAFGNFLARIVVPNRARELTITVGLIADMKRTGPNTHRSFTRRHWPTISGRICGRSARTAKAPARASWSKSGCRVSLCRTAPAPSISSSR
jgi:transglutaminase-like putative cysteine protease